MSEDLLARFAVLPLIDGYDVYQHPMSYWDEVMQDDAGILAIDGWDAAKMIRKVERDEDKKFPQEPDIKLGGGESAIYLKVELIPPALIIPRFFADETANVEQLESEVEWLEAELAAKVEEHGGEEGDISKVVDEDGDLDVKAVKARRAVLVAGFDKGIFKQFEKAGQLEPARWRDDFLEKLPDFLEFCQINEALKLADAIKDAKAEVKATRATLDKSVVKQYPKLTPDEAKALVIDDKWLARLAAAVEGNLERVAQRLLARCGELAERYGRKLPDLMKAAKEAQARVAADLAKTGFAL